MTIPWGEPSHRYSPVDDVSDWVEDLSLVPRLAYGERARSSGSNILSNSFEFGGINATLVFGRRRRNGRDA